MIVVADSSPLIGLSKASRLSLLPRLFGPVLIPPEVYRDVVVRGRGRPGARAVENAIKKGWILIEPVRDRSLIPPLFSDVGEGEAIALAREQHSDVLLLDDRAARGECTRLGILWLTTGGILCDAHQMKLIRKLRPVLDRMQREGFGIWNYEELLQSVGE